MSQGYQKKSFASLPLAVLKAEAPGESRILRAGPDIDALRRIEMVSVDEDDAKSGQRLSAPADRRTCAVWTVEHLDRDAQQFLHSREAGIRLLARLRLVGNLGPPCQAEQPPALLLVVAKQRSSFGGNFDVIQRRGCASARPAAKEHVIAPDDHRFVRQRRVERALEGHRLDS